MSKVKFDDLPESREKSYINEAGPQIGFNVDNIEYVDRREKEGKQINAMVKVMLESADKKFTITKFEPVYKEEDVRYPGDIYEKGVVVRKRTAAEEIQHQFNEAFYFFEQLAKAWKATPEQITKFKKGIGEKEVDVLFKTMFDKFLEIFPLEKYRNAKINFKIAWKNNKIDKSSFLQLCKPSASNIIFKPFTDEKSSGLIMTPSEEKNMVRMFTAQDRAPQGSAAENEDWRNTDVPGAIAADNGEERPLF